MDNNDIKNINDWEVLTPSGWSNFTGIKKIIKHNYLKITFTDNSILECSKNHKIKLIDNKFVYAADLQINNVVIGKKDNKTISTIEFINESIDLYDLLNVEKDNEYFANDIINHNCAFIENVEELWASAQQTLATIPDGKAVACSTPFGIGGFFYKTWVDAENQTNGFHPIKLKWNLHPERNQKWRDDQTKELGDKLARQECDADFTTSGDNVISAEVFDFYAKQMVKDPLYIEGDSTWIWKNPDYNRSYILSADCAKGDGKDFSAAHVIDTETLEQVAEIYNQHPFNQFGMELLSLAMRYNEALLIIESNGIGPAVIQKAIDNNYPNLFYMSADLKYIDVHKQLTTRFNAVERNLKPGFYTSTGTRPLIINKFNQYINEKVIKFHSNRMLNEIKTYIWNKGKAEAMEGYHDDLILSFSIGVWVQETALRLKQESIQCYRSMMNNIHRTQYTGSMPMYNNKTRGSAQDSWSMKVGREGKKENLFWLL